MPEVQLQPLPPTEAIAYFRTKGLEPSFSWQDVWQEEHSKAFTVAKMMNRDLLEDTRAAVDKALSEGQTFEQFKAELMPKMKAAGWWGKAEMLDPATGKMKTVQLGSNSRLRTIFDTNLRTSRARGHWQRIERTKKAFPFLIYVAVRDGRTRPLHRSWDTIVLPVDHPWWDTHFPPNGWHCRCIVIQANQAMLDRMGLKVTQNPPTDMPVIFKNRRTGEISMVPRGIDPGFGFNVGKTPLRPITPRPEVSDLNADAIAPALVSGFLQVFGAAKKPRIIKDRENWPLVISGELFLDANGNETSPLPKLAHLLPIVAKALKAYDRAVWIWGKDASGKAVLIRRYIKRLDNQTIEVDFSAGTWTYRIID